MVSLPFFAGPEHAPFALGDGPRRALLIHGFPGTPAEMRPLGELLGAAGWRAHGLLLPGMGSEIARLGEMRRRAWIDAARRAGQATLREAPVGLTGRQLHGARSPCTWRRRPRLGASSWRPFWHIGALGSLLPLAKHVVRTIAPFSRANFGDPALRAELLLAPGIDLDDVATQLEIRTRLRLPTAVLDEVRLLGAAAYREARAQVLSPTLVLQGTDDRVVRRADTRRLLVRLAGPVVYHEFTAGHELVLLSGPALRGQRRPCVRSSRPCRPASRWPRSSNRLDHVHHVR